MTTLHERLQEAVNERLRIAEAATPGPWWDSPVRGSSGYHTIRGGPGDWRGFDGSLGGDTRPIARIEPAPDGDGGFATNHDADAAHIAANDPARIVRDCQRDLRVLARHKPASDEPQLCRWCFGDEGDYFPWPCDEIKDLAEAYQIDLEVSDDAPSAPLL